MIYTIGREYGSGGTWAGRELAKKLSIPFYDKELLIRTAAESGLCPGVIKQKDEKYKWTDFFYGQADQDSTLSMNMPLPLQHKIFRAQSDTIEKIAQEGPCVIVGRCADYILRDRKDLFRVFVYADEDSRARRVVDIETSNAIRDGINAQYDEAKAKELIRKADKQRKNYYNFHAEGKWGDKDIYDLMIRSDGLSYEQIAEIIIAASQYRK